MANDEQQKQKKGPMSNFEEALGYVGPRLVSLLLGGHEAMETTGKVLEQYQMYEGTNLLVSKKDTLTNLVSENITKVSSSILKDPVYLFISDISNLKLSKDIGAIYSPKLNTAPDNACELTADGTLTVFNDYIDISLYNTPGTIGYNNSNNEYVTPVSNSEYSPMKRLMHKGICITLNIPIIAALYPIVLPFK